MNNEYQETEFDVADDYEMKDFDIDDDAILEQQTLDEFRQDTCLETFEPLDGGYWG